MKHGARFDRLAVILGAAALLGMAGDAGAQDNGEYGVLMKTLSNPFWGAMEKGVDEGAKEAGVDIFLQAVEIRPGGRAAAQRLQHHAARASRRR